MREIKITPAKYNAYYALSSSATYEVTTPRVLVVPDCERKMSKAIDWVDDNEEITCCEKELGFNLFDGMGLISPAFAEIWANDMGCDYVPSSFVCRACYIKGNLMVFDFQKFAREVAGKTIVTDIYGEEVDVERIDVVLTQSQFKLWNAYESWGEYEKKLAESGLSWGVSRVAPERDKDYARVNYQFIQVLNLTDEEVERLCKPTVDWLQGVAGGDTTKVMLYLLGKVADCDEASKAWGRIQDNYLKCLIADNRLISDGYIRNRILKSINKKIKESYIGKLLVHGNYQEIFADGYALCEHIFGMEVKGLLRAGEHYSAYWNDRGVKNVVAMRSPLTWRSEVNRLTLLANEKVCEWFKYVKSGIIYNVWGVDNMLQAGSDYDGDGVFTTDNEIFLKCRYGGVPVAYEPKKAPKESLSRNELMGVSYLGFNTKIGYITNLSTTMYEMQAKYEEGSAEYEEIEKRLKLCCFHQSQTIDSAKGIETTPIAKEWTKYTRITDDMCDDEAEYYALCNRILIEDRPYFMRHLYYNYNKKYKDTMADFNRYCEIKYGKTLEGIKNEDSEEARAVFDYYNKKLGFLTTNGAMNRVSRHMENSLKEIRHIGKSQQEVDIYGILSGGSEFTEEQVQEMLSKIVKYNHFKRNRLLGESQYATCEQYYKALRAECLCEISPSVQTLADIAVYICYKMYPKKAKDFAWDVFGSGISKNVLSKKPYVCFPLAKDGGDIEYLGKCYDLAVLPLGEVHEDMDEILNFDIDGTLFLGDDTNGDN